MDRLGTEPEGRVDGARSDSILECTVRYTDQNPKGTGLVFGGTGLASFYAERIELTGVVTHGGLGHAAVEVIAAFNPIASALSTLERGRRGPETVVLPLARVEALVFDPHRRCFAVVAVAGGGGAGMQRCSWPFRLGRDAGMSVQDVASALRSLYPGLYVEGRLPREHRRLLALFMVMIALLGVGVLLAHLYPG
ncbi:MAG: hypothetical protein ACYSU0_00040 [Planctomycetota bacterium]